MDDEVSRSITAAARRHLVKAGACNLSLDAVAAEADLTVAEVESRFAHRDDLLTKLIIDAYDASGAAMERADQASQENGEAPGARLLAVARALRTWSLDNPAEFALIYGSPVPDYAAPPDTIGPATRTPAALAGIVRAALETGELLPPRRSVPGPPLVNEVALELFGGPPPAPYSDLIERGIVLWSGLVGLLIFEVFSRTHDSVQDQGKFFDYGVAVTAETVGLTVPAGDPTG